MKFTSKLWVFLMLGIWVLITGVAGVIFQMLQPESFRGETTATVYIPAGCLILACVAYRVYQYHKNPNLVAADDKQRPDERLLRVQEKGAVVAISTTFFSMLFCAIYAEYICTIFLGITDPAVIRSLGLLFGVIGLFNAGVFFLSIIYYYYARF
ncbi:hypothetical protein McpSp1_14000 [Methanocorpusculaceae archaeon Sp1]|nr:hypothetical protein [Methanocorpusculaceae archaeon Sp1]